MTNFVDYKYHDNGSPAPRNWANLKGLLGLSNPSCLPQKSPPNHELNEIVITPSQFYWEAVATGYGDAGGYINYWLINGVLMTSKQQQALKKLARSRITMLSRAYDLVSANLATPAHLRPMDVYPLIESTEKVVLSYMLGSVVAAISAPRILAARPGAPIIKYLFHAKLLGSSLTAVNPLVVNATSGKSVDFISFDTNGGLHIFEAKGSGAGFPYDKLADGLNQCLAVTGVSIFGGGTVYPASLNVLVSFVGQKSVSCGAKTVSRGVRAASFEVLHSPPPSAITHPTFLPTSVAQFPKGYSILVGKQAVTVFFLVNSIATSSRTVDGWVVFDFQVEEMERERVQVAIPERVYSTVEEHFYELRDELAVKEFASPIFRNGALAVDDFLASQREEMIGKFYELLGGSVLKLEESGLPPVIEGFSRSAAIGWVIIA